LKKNYWFYIANHVYCNIIKNKAFLYNTNNGASIETQNSNIIKIITEIFKDKNLGVISLIIDDSQEVELTAFINNIIEYNMGGLILKKDSKTKPIQLMPILNIQNDINKLEKDTNRSIGENVMKYLHELNIYIEDECILNCKGCNEFSNQFVFCKNNTSPSKMNDSILKRVFSQLQTSFVSRINIISSNVFKSIKHHIISDNFPKLSPRIYYHTFYKNIIKQTIPIDLLSNIVILVNNPIDKDIFEKFDKNIFKNSTFNFIVEDLLNYNQIMNLVKQYNIHNFKIKPFYNGGNINFFKENIFLSSSDLFEKEMPMRYFFCNQTLNTNNFGTLNILSSGEVKANLNTKVLGNINNNSIKEMIHKELITNTAWRQIRNSEPCISCLYQFLCPPTSNYEMIFKQINLCNVKNC